MIVSVIAYEANVQKRVGSNEYAFELLKSLYELDKRNQYFLYLPKPPLPDMPQERNNWHYRVVGPDKLWSFLALPKALFCQRPKPDVIFNPGHYCPLVFPAPLVVAVMDLGYLRWPEQFTKPIFLKLKLWTAWSIKRAAHILAISESTRDDIIKRYCVKPDKITVTYPGFDKKRFCFRVRKLAASKLKNKYRIKKKYCLFLGTLRPSKNIEGLIEAFSLLVDDYPEMQLMVAGKKGWLYQPIYDWAEQLEVEGKIVFAGFVDNQDLPGLIKGAEVFLQPSFWEGFGIPVVEAMALGTPVVVSDRGSLPEVVGKAGVVVDPEKTVEIVRGIKKAIKHRAALVKKGLNQVKKFDWDESAQRTLAVLAKVSRR